MTPQHTPDDFEKRLSRQPLKQIPGAWRAEILAAASAAPASESCRRVRPNLFSVLAQQCSAVLWPDPKAWTGLAAVWLMVAILHFSIREKSSGPASQTIRPSPEVLAELRQQHRLYAELMGVGQTSDFDRPRPVLIKPRSELERVLAA